MQAVAVSRLLWGPEYLAAVRVCTRPLTEVSAYDSAENTNGGWRLAEDRQGSPCLAWPTSCMPGYCEVINPYIVGSLTIPRASIKRVQLWELLAYNLNMHLIVMRIVIGRDWLD